MSNVIVVTQPKKTIFQRVSQGLAVAGTFVLTQSAFAASELDSLATTATGYLDTAKTAALGVFAVGIILVGIFKGYSKMKQGINRA